MHIALFEPEIAQNVGSVIRLGACFDMIIDVIHPLGFVWDDKRLTRSAMDYLRIAHVAFHDSVDDFFEKYRDRRIILMDAHASASLWAFDFDKDDIILFGKESTGFPMAIREKLYKIVNIPMPQKKARSLNLAMACAIVTGEAHRQNVQQRGVS